MTDRYGRILGFLDRSRYFFYQVAPQLYSRGWVDPVPDPLLLRISGSTESRTRGSGTGSTITVVTTGLLAYIRGGWWSSRWNDWQGKPKYSEKSFISAALSTTNPTCPDPGSNPNIRNVLSNADQIYPEQGYWKGKTSTPLIPGSWGTPNSFVMFYNVMAEFLQNNFSYMMYVKPIIAFSMQYRTAGAHSYVNQTDKASSRGTLRLEIYNLGGFKVLYEKVPSICVTIWSLYKRCKASRRHKAQDFQPISSNHDQDRHHSGLAADRHGSQPTWVTLHFKNYISSIIELR
jgi:hypothetical protein